MPLKNACLRVLSRLTLLGMLALTGPALCADETDPSLQWMEDLPEEKHQALKALIEQGRRRKEERQRAEAGLTAAPQVPDVQATAPKESAKENDKNMLSDAGLAERYDAITALAQDDPTDENVRQWLLAREVLKEKRVRFEEALQRLSKDGKPSGAGMGSETSNTPTPDALMPWVQWAIADREAAVLCTWRHDGSQTDCAWPGRLALSVSDDGAVFSLDWETRAPSWLELPGDGAAWPTVVQDGTQPLAVVMREGRPMTYIAKSGAQSVRLSGRLQWLKRPESIQLPAVVALSDIQIDGAPVAQNRIDDAGRLWLSAREGEADMDSAATERVEVYRLIEDGRPATVTTRIELDIGGPARALTFQNVLPEGFLPLGIRSALPASIDANGKLVLQVRRGHWSVEVSARSLREVTRLTVGVPGQTWPQEEVWAFRPDAGFRDVELSGGRAIAPEQTAIPTAWRGDRTFLMGRGEALELAALRRADGDGEADRMRLARTAWMDFDGTGITVKDLMTGSLGAPGRLEAVGALMPGRIVVDGTARQLTTLEEEAGAGVMVRRGETSIEAHGRLATPVASAFAHWPLHLPASGWNRPLQQVTMNLEVPPGWTAIEAFGADRANGLWLRQWTVMEIFLVIVSVIVIGRLYGWWLGVLALPTLVLSWHAAAAPGVLWLGFALLGALHRHLRASPLRGLWRSATTLATGLAAAAVLVSAIAFSSMAVQSALFPQLLENDIMRSAPLMRMTSDASKNVQGEAGAEASTAPGRYGDREVALQRIDPDAKIGTGPGTPRWGANRTVLHWDGPNAQATASIYLLTADQTRIANSVAALLVLSLAGFLVAAAFGRRPRPPGMPKLPRWRLPKPKWPRLKLPKPKWPPLKAPWASKRVSLLSASILGAGLLMSSGTAVGGTSDLVSDTGGGAFPQSDLLSQLGTRLTAPPACAPTCADVAMAWLSVEGEEGSQRFGVRLSVNAQTETAVPLLKGMDGWVIDTVAVNDADVQARTDSAGVWTRVPAGVSMVDISGALPVDGTARLEFALQPRLVDIVSSGEWTIDGVDNAGHTRGAVTLTKAGGGGAEDAAAVRSQIPPLVHLQRTVRMGLDWTVENTAVRMSPSDGALVLRASLLPGESVMSEEVGVDGDAVVLAFGSGEVERRWNSRIEVRPELVLTAAADPALLETWRLDVGDLWDVQALGVSEMAPARNGLREWRPWPGESLAIDVVRPRGLPVPTVTIESASLDIQQGQTGRENVLSLQITASEGGRHHLGLPADAVPDQVLLDGVRQERAVQEGGIDVALAPGQQTLQVRWQEDDAGGAFYTSPQVVLGADAVNAQVRVQVSDARWVLWADGPMMGPVVRVWGWLAVAVLLLGMLAAARIDTPPIGYLGWLVIALGLSQAAWGFVLVPIAIAAFRSKRYWEDARPLAYNAGQTLLGIAALGSALAFYQGIAHGLLGMPDMHIAGNGSSGHLLQWYQDRTVGSQMPLGTVVSAPMWVYRLVMLAWALLAALVVTRLARWFWSQWRRPVMLREAPLAGEQGGQAARKDT